MARMKGPRFKKCRSLGLNVCGHPKAMDRANGRNARDSKKLSPYGQQLLEKQRLRAYYEVMEKQFRKYVKEAMKDERNTGDVLVKRLEMRLDNMVYRMGFASSIRQARQMVVHGHIRVDGNKVDRPSYKVSVGSQIGLSARALKNEMFKENFDSRVSGFPYIQKQENQYMATLLREPNREEVPIEIKDHLVIEYYSKIV